MTSDEFELAVSTQLLDDRITISANGNMDVGGNRNAAGDENRKNNIAGDFDIEVKLNKQGSLKMRLTPIRTRSCYIIIRKPFRE